MGKLSSARTRASRRVRESVMALFAALLALSGMIVPLVNHASAATAAPTIASDKPDYAPGSTVTLTGTNWAGGESVHIVVNDTVGQTWQHDVTVTAASDGTVTDVFTLPNYFVANYGVIATGPVSGTATTTFTDAVLPSGGVQLTNWTTAGNQANSWITGTLNTTNSDYKEGETVPFRVEMSANQVPTSGNPYYAPVCRDYFTSQSGGVYGYTTLQPFDTSRNADPGGTITSTSGAFSGVGLSILQVSDPQASSGTLDGNTFDCGTTQHLVIVKFNMTATTGTAYLLFGGRLSAPGDTNPPIAFGHSSSNFPGGSLQMRLASPDKTAGINPGAIIQLAKITVTKVVDSGTATPDEWCFTATGPNNFSSQQCIPSGQSSVDFLALNTGSYTITESSVNGYSFASGTGTNCTFSGSTATATVTAAAGGATNASCTFHNALQTGSLKITKHLDNPPNGYDTSTTYTIHYDCGTGFTGDVHITAGSSATTITGIPTGTTCVVTEPSQPTPPSSYTFGSPTFSPVGADSTGVTIGNGTTVEVIVTNSLSRDQGKIELKKHWVGTPGNTTVSIDQGGTNIGSAVANGVDNTTGEKVVDTGTYALSETPLSGYTTTLNCFNDNGAGGGTANDGAQNGTEPTVSSAGNNVAVAKGDDIVCTFTNTRDQGKIELKKHWVGTAGNTTVSITQGANTIGSAVANGVDNTTGEKVVDTGTFKLNETALTNYDTTLTCFNDNGAGGGTANNGIKDGSEPAVSVDASNNVNVNKADDVVCTFTNTRQQGKIELKKHWIGTPGTTTVSIDQGGTNIGFAVASGADNTTGEKTVDTGTFALSETALSNYDTTLTCFNDNGAGGGTANNGIKDGSEPAVSVDASNNVNVNKNDDVVCTFTNTRQQGKIELKKHWVGTAGNTTVSITQGANTIGSAIANGADNTTGEKTVDTGNYTMNETAVPNYGTTLSCFNDNGAGGGIANNGTQDGAESSVSAPSNIVAVGSGDDVVCTFTNTRDQGKIELKKHWVGTAGNTTVSITQGANTIGSAIANGADNTTGEKIVDTGTFTLHETAVPNYGTTLSCFNDNGAGGGTANNGTKDGGEADVNVDASSNVAVGTGDDVVCTFVNTRDQGKIELKKHWVGTAGNTTVSITQGANTIGSAIANGADNTTGEKTVDTGTFTLHETTLTNYDTTLTCFNDNGAGGGTANNGTKDGGEADVTVGAGNIVTVNSGDDVVCTFTNTRQTGKIELKKHWVGTAGTTTISITQGPNTIGSALANGADATTGEKVVDTGVYTLNETTLTNYGTTVGCFNDNGAGGGIANNGIHDGGEVTVTVDASNNVTVNQGDDVVCAFINTRDQGKIELKKHWVGTAGNTTVTITQGGNTIGSAVANGADATTGEKTVDTGTFTVNETAVPNYGTTLTCFNDNGAGGGTANNGVKDGGEADVNVGSGNTVPVAKGDDVVCTFTNTRDQGKIELKKHWVGTAGNTTVSIAQGANTIGSAAANGADNTTGEKLVDTGAYHLSETAVPNYATTLTCFNDNGAGGGTANNGNKDGGEATVTPDASNNVTVNSGDDVVCTFTNTRDQGKIELKKHWVGTAGNTTVSIAQGANTIGSAVANGVDNTTGEKLVDTGTYHLSETAVPNYGTTLTCFNDNGAGGGTANNGTKDGGEADASVDANNNVNVNKGDDVVCTFTNTRDQGNIELKKHWVGTPGNTTISITQGANTIGSAAANGADNTTGQKTVDTGTYHLSETAVPNYGTTLGCFNDNGAGGGIANNGMHDGGEVTVTVDASNNVTVNQGDDVVCVFINTRDQGKIELKKHWVGTPGNTTVTITQGANTIGSAVANGVDNTTGEKVVDTGTFKLNETTLTNYDTTLVCFNDNGAGGGTADNGIKDGAEADVSVAAGNNVNVNKGDDVVCTFTNTRQQGKIELKKHWVGTPGNTTVSITQGANTIGSAVANGVDNTTGEKVVDTGTFTVNETTLTNYDTTLSCFNDNGAGGGTANNGIKDGGETDVSVAAGNNVTVNKGDDVVCTFVNTRQTGTITIVKLTDPPNTGNFAFTTTGTGYNGFTIPGGGHNTQTLDTGTYTVQETQQNGWILTGIGQNPADPNNPLACAVTGTGGSTGIGDLTPGPTFGTATIVLKKGDTVTCTFENSARGVTRTQGFWATHTQLANVAWFGGTWAGQPIAGVAGTAGIGDTKLCGRDIVTSFVTTPPPGQTVTGLAKLMGGFWSGISKQSNGDKRSQLNQNRMQLLQQLLAAELNASMFGTVPSGGSGMFAQWEAAYCTGTTKQISDAQSQAAAFNTSGDTQQFTPGTSADAKNARAIAYLPWWDDNVLP